VELVVDVAGRVRRPGVYRFEQGDRVIDAIRRAGGALPGADLASLNLAALLTDAEQIVVGRRGAGGLASGTTTGSGAVGGGSGATVPGDQEKVNVNTATLDELEALPGIGPVLAQRIIDYRTEHGGFRKIDELMEVPGIGPAKFAELKDKITV
jgi:competence protein ComEA